MQQRNLLEIEFKKLAAEDKKRKEARREKIAKSKGSITESTVSLEEIDLVEIMAGKTDDPFVPHENILSKYSAMVRLSTAVQSVILLKERLNFA